MTGTLVGYFPKKRTTRSYWASPYPDHPNAPFPVGDPVEEIGSISDCIAQGPEGWRDQRRHNFYDLYDAPELAWGVVPAEARAGFELFAYRLYPVQFEHGREEPIDLWWELAVESMPHSFVRLGWDAVQGGNHHGFGCSPLSCNMQASQVGIPAVNRYCLVGSEQEGNELARHFSVAEPEPGPYCVVEVWRDTARVVEPVAADVTMKVNPRPRDDGR